jgi:glycosyltransferase involved in cell wall biosynthesis
VIPVRPSTISIIVPVFNGGDDLRTCLQSIAACRPPATEVIVVDDGSRDDSAAVADAMQTRCLRLSTQRGPAFARNRGAEVATGEILFFVDADVALAANAVGEVQAEFSRRPHLAALFGSYDDEPAAANLLSQYKNLLHHHVHQTSAEEAWTFWAGCGAVRRAAFVAVGGFDESYARPSIEDIELGARLRHGGYEIGLHKALQGKHLKRWGVVSLLRTDIQCRALPWAKLLLRQGELTNDLNLRWSSRLSSLAVFLLCAAAVGALWRPLLWLVAAVLAATLLVLNLPLYRFFCRKRGIWFALACIPWHWLYYLYSGAAFAVVYARHRIAR